MSVQLFNARNTQLKPFHIYYDLNLINNDSSFPANPVRFQYKETRSNDYLLSPQDYFMSIVRFNLQTPTLPVFIPQINLNVNRNLGTAYPIRLMTGASPAGFTITTYTLASTIPVGTVVYLQNNNNNPATNDASNVGQNYYRITAVTNNQSLTQTTVTVANASYSVGVPNNYPGNGANFTRGGTQLLRFANLVISGLSFNTTTLALTITIANPATLANLQNVFLAGDMVFVNNAGGYNGRYAVTQVTTTTLVVFASSLRDVVLSTYTSGGFLLPAGDYVNVTPYEMTMKYDVPGGASVVYTQPVTFYPNDLTQAPPVWNPAQAQPLTLADITSTYYYVYTYESLILMLNQAISNCFWGLNGKVYATAAATLPMTGSLGTPTSNNYQPPSIAWNSDTLKGIITADANAFRQATFNSTNIIFWYFNQPLSTLLDSFPYQYPNVNPDSVFYSYLYFNGDSGAGNFIVSSYSVTGTPTTQYVAIQIYQDHQTASLMNPIQSIVFTTTLLPVVMENVGAPLIINGASSNQIIAGSNANVFPVVTDFIVPFSATNTYQPDISYVPSGEYRLVDMYGESPAKQIDVQVFWKDQYGLLHPFLVGSGCTGSLKIMFRSKYYNNIASDMM